MKRQYVTPEVKVVELEEKDIIATSTGAEGEDPNVDW